MTVLEFLKNYPEFKVGDYLVTKGFKGKMVNLINRLPVFDIERKSMSFVLPDNANDSLVSMTGYRVMYEMQGKLFDRNLDFFNIDIELFDEIKHKDLLVQKERLDLVIKLEKLK